MRGSALAVGAAWAAPAILQSIGAPLAAASPDPNLAVDNDVANFYYDPSADAGMYSMAPAEGGGKFTVSTQMNYRAVPWKNPPSSIMFHTFTFDRPVTMDPTYPLAPGVVKVSPSNDGPATTFVFSRPGTYDMNVTAQFSATPGPLESSTSMAMTGTDNTPWSPAEPAKWSNLTPTASGIINE